MKSEKVDLSPLDPSKDEPRWNRLVESIASRALKAHRRQSFKDQLLAWARPALAFAVIAALAAIMLPLFLSSDVETTAVETQEPAVALASWAAQDRVPATAAILNVFGGTNGSN